MSYFGPDDIVLTLFALIAIACIGGLVWFAICLTGEDEDAERARRAPPADEPDALNVERRRPLPPARPDSHLWPRHIDDPEGRN